jgi:hypothetical protein
MKQDYARNFTFRLPLDVYDVVTSEARARRMTTARLVRLALAAFLEANSSGGNVLAQTGAAKNG